MSKSELPLKERLFNAYATNLSYWRPQIQNVFLCPLCFHLFRRDALCANDLVEERIILTEEHIIPEKLGGRLLTLTCKGCNNRDGSHLDAHLIQRSRAEDFLAGRSQKPFQSRVQIGDGEMGADLYVFTGDPPRLEIHDIRRISNPELHDTAVRTLNEGHVQGRIRLNLGYNTLRSGIAALRVAYLLMFRHFGYGYILHKSVQQVRNQILNPENDLIASKAVIQLEQAPPYPNSVHLLYSPKNLRCFFATVDLSTALDRHLEVVMPGLDVESGQIYDRWSALGENIREVQYSMALISFDSQEREISKIVADPRNAELLHQIWNNVCKINIG